MIVVISLTQNLQRRALPAFCSQSLLYHLSPPLPLQKHHGDAPSRRPHYPLVNIPAVEGVNDDDGEVIHFFTMTQPCLSNLCDRGFGVSEPI
jgi:hypothetical protein